jgi:thiosulfate/3-mercaptopyruvate sulfurtransferase
MIIQLACIVLIATPGDEKQNAADRSGQYPRPELLIEVKELSEHEGLKKFRIFDARPFQDYQAGRIPGATWIDTAQWNKVFTANQDEEGWAERLGKLGLELDTPLVVYGEGVSPDAARVWWILRYWGFRDVRLLNGGWKAWKSSGGRVADAREPMELHPPTEIKLAPNKDRLATKQQVLRLVESKDRQIVDARSTGEFCGESNTAKRNGAMPGAVHLEWTELIDKTSQRFKPPAEMRKLFKDKGIDLRRPIVTHCQSGGRSSVMAFALELMGGDQVRNYYKSWAEWGNAEDTPVVKPAKP